jgi:hypothetical protein
MSRRFRIAFLTAVFLAAPATFGAAQTPTPSIHYDASKSNTGNFTAPKPGNGNGQPGMAVKGSGVPQNGTTVTGGGGGAERMGGGGGARGGGALMGGGGGARMGGGGGASTK